MPFDIERFKAAARASLFHLQASLVVFALAAALVLLAWYPAPYYQLSGGLYLFLLLVGVDIICGPILTLILYSPRKHRRELLADMSFIVFFQLSALLYGLHTAYVARPLFLVHEVDRFRVIASGDFGETPVDADIAKLDASLRPRFLHGPAIVGIRAPKDSKERQEVMMESVLGGRDYAQRPDFYVSYDAAYAPKALARARPLQAFVTRYPNTADTVIEILHSRNVKMSEARFLPVLHKQDWIAVLDSTANILGFVPGDGFDVSAEPK